MVDADGGNDRQLRDNDVSGVVPASKSHFDRSKIAVLLLEVQKASGSKVLNMLYGLLRRR
jgi:hypothetical protein